MAGADRTPFGGWKNSLSNGQSPIMAKIADEIRDLHELSMSYLQEELSFDLPGKVMDPGR